MDVNYLCALGASKSSGPFTVVSSVNYKKPANTSDNGCYITFRANLCSSIYNIQKSTVQPNAYYTLIIIKS